jgi:hypothetical protein
MTSDTNIKINVDENKNIKKERSKKNKKDKVKQETMEQSKVVKNSSKDIGDDNIKINNAIKVIISKKDNSNNNKDINKDIKKGNSYKDRNRIRYRNRNKDNKRSLEKNGNFSDSPKENNIDNNKVVINRKLRGPPPITEEAIIYKINNNDSVDNNKNHNKKSNSRTISVKDKNRKHDLYINHKNQSVATIYNKSEKSINDKVAYVTNIEELIKNNENESGLKNYSPRKSNDARVNKNSQKFDNNNNNNNKNQRKTNNEKEKIQKDKPYPSTNMLKNIFNEKDMKNNKCDLNKSYQPKYENSNRDYTVASIHTNVKQLTIEEATLILQQVGSLSLKNQQIRSGSNDTLQQKINSNSIKNQSPFSKSPTSTANLKATAKEFQPSPKKEFESNENMFLPQEHPLPPQHIVSQSNLNQMNSIYLPNDQQIQQSYNIYEQNSQIIYAIQDESGVGNWYQPNDINHIYPPEITDHHFNDSPTKIIQLNNAKPLSPRAKEFSPRSPRSLVNNNSPSISNPSILA